MGTTDIRIDSYIEKSQEFAKPILEHLRKLVHKGCPDIQETIKWSFPHFDYHGIMCSMASFKHHCTFNFWKGDLLTDPYEVFVKTGETAMGQLGRITKLSDLPDDKILIEYIREAMRLNEEGVKQLSTHKSKTEKKLDIPTYFLEAVKNNKHAAKVFESFSYSNKKEYVEWITEAKTEETRNKRLRTAIEWMAEGKVRNWKYLKNT